ncbi:MAG: hypothetical protein MI863_18080 [Desulfobacterales bacterium]|nr:hypothetical protein [Desulfobacterales bacterium]
MFRRILTLLVLGTFVFPVFGSLGNHDFKLAVHAAYEAHHSEKKHGHTAHDHSEPESSTQHHLIDIGLVSFFKDYLHADLQIRSQKGGRFVKEVKKIPGIACTILFGEIYSESVLPFKQQQPGALARNDLYLTTQRLRIGV